MTNKKMRKSGFIFLLLGLSLFSIGRLFACSTFVLEDEGKHYFGRNFDFGVGEAHINLNKRGQLKSALIAPPEKALSWVSKYGSLTFNQVGREFPYGGMNEAGLVIEIMMLDETLYEPADSRYGMMEVQWLQYNLDSFATVNEVLAAKASIRISRESFSKVHFLLTDKSGKTAIIEFIEGKMKIYKGKRLPVKAITNNSYKDSLRFISGTLPLPPGEEPDESLLRFSTIAEMLDDYESAEDNGVNYAFSILNAVTIPNWTKWSIVYDPARLELHYRTHLDERVKTISLKEFDLSAQAPSLYRDIDHGNELPFLEYNKAANRLLLETVCSKDDFLSHMPIYLREAVIAYPESVIPVR